jgi:hypothetical protein
MGKKLRSKLKNASILVKFEFHHEFLVFAHQGFVKKTIFNISNVTEAEVNEERNW